MMVLRRKLCITVHKIVRNAHNHIPKTAGEVLSDGKLSWFLQGFLESLQFSSLELDHTIAFGASSCCRVCETVVNWWENARPERRLLEADEVGCQWTQLEEELCLTVSIIIGLNSLLSGMLCSFGSFFGPSEPIVAKRIIDEAAAREVTVMVAARAAKQAQVCPNYHSHNASFLCMCVCTHYPWTWTFSKIPCVVCLIAVRHLCSCVVCLKKEYGQLTYVIRDDVVLVVLVHNIVSFLSRKVVHCESYPIVMSTHPWPKGVLWCTTTQLSPGAKTGIFCLIQLRMMWQVHVSVNSRCPAV